VLFVHVAESDKLAAASRFRDLLSGFVQLLRRQVHRYQGRVMDTDGDSALVFDSLARAIGTAAGDDLPGDTSEDAARRSETIARRSPCS